MTVSEFVQKSLFAESLLFAGRLLTVWRRQPLVSIQAVLYPTFLLVTLKLLVGKSVLRITGTDSLYGLVPMCAVAGAMFGAFSASFSVQIERDTGLLGRLWVLPIYRISPLAGRLLADAARTLLGVSVITAVGLALGLRFQAGWLSVVPFILVPVIVGTVFSIMVTAVAIRTKDSTALVFLTVPSLGAVFTNSGVAPVEGLPGWMGPLQHLNPFAPTLEAMRALAQGRPALWPLVLSSIWAVGMVAVVGPLAVSGYRAAATLAR